MRLGFELEISILRISAVVVRKRPLNVDGMGVMPLDQIAVVAIH
jgi:hypothetical protein